MILEYSHPFPTLLHIFKGATNPDKQKTKIIAEEINPGEGRKRGTSKFAQIVPVRMSPRNENQLLPTNTWGVILNKRFCHRLCLYRPVLVFKLPLLFMYKCIEWLLLLRSLTSYVARSFTFFWLRWNNFSCHLMDVTVILYFILNVLFHSLLVWISNAPLTHVYL